jgi:hypothetical protein
MKTKLIHMNRLAKLAFWIEAMLSQFAGFFVAFITPLAPFALLTIFFVFADQYTGRQAARKRGEEITSKGIRRTVEKLGLYIGIMLLAEGFWYVFLRGLPFPVPLTYGVAIQICYAELVSNLENASQITGKKIAIPPITDIIKRKF